MCSTLCMYMYTVCVQHCVHVCKCTLCVYNTIHIYLHVHVHCVCVQCCVCTCTLCVCTTCTIYIYSTFCIYMYMYTVYMYLHVLCVCSTLYTCTTVFIKIIDIIIIHYTLYGQMTLTVYVLWLSYYNVTLNFLIRKNIELHYIILLIIIIIMCNHYISF